MYTTVIEAEYPLYFRKEEASLLGEHLRHRHSVDLIGMKRVGISNFLRFFLFHKDVVSTYITNKDKQLFIPVDLNDLVERELFPFWTLTLKRIVDVTEKSSINSKEKLYIESLFLKAIQSQDLFLAMDYVRQSLVKIIEQGLLPTLFFLRFDRIKDVVTPEFFDNLHGLRDATNQQLAYVFTSYRSLDQLSPAVFTRPSFSVFSHHMYIKLAKLRDIEIIYETYNRKYQLELSEKLKRHLFDLVHGYVQYLQLSLIILHEQSNAIPENSADLFSLLMHDERILLQSEELWESLTDEEKQTLVKIVKRENISAERRTRTPYLWDSEFVIEKDSEIKLFSPFLQAYIEQLLTNNHPQSQAVHFSKKEHALFQVLEQHVHTICEREDIIATVWPEYSEVGVSDWAIDRLVARVRTKLKQQDSSYEIKTIRTRGYQLVKKEQ